MANILTTNPLQIDTAGVIYAKGTPYSIKSVSYQAAADDQDVLLSDESGNVIWKAKVGDVSEDGYNWAEKLDYTANEGLTCTTIDGGLLLIYQ